VNNPHNSCAGFEENLVDAPSPLPQITPWPASPALAQVEDALDTLLTRLLEERERERQKRLASGQPLPPLRVLSLPELLAEPSKSDEEIWREIVVEHPITGAFEFAIREIGKMLFHRAAPI
jgi:hypothetical protein